MSIKGGHAHEKPHSAIKDNFLIEHVLEECVSFLNHIHQWAKHTQKVEPNKENSFMKLHGFLIMDNLGEDHPKGH
jgi:hypothetical protein